MAIPTLRTCASGDDIAAPACILALVGTRDTRGGAPIMRRRLRLGGSGRTVAAAAVALGAWKDHHSHSLLVDALLAGRGGGLGGQGLADAIDALDRPFRHTYLRFAHELTRDPELRLALAARLMRLAPWVERSPLAAALDTAFETWTAGDGFAGRLAIWGLTRGLPAECETVLLTLASSDHWGADVRRAVSSQCAASGVELGVELEVPSQAHFPSPPRADLPQATEAWLVGAGLWSVAEAELLAGALRDASLRRLGGRRWTPFSALRLAGGVQISAEKRWRLGKIGVDRRFPETFDDFRPIASQPDWFPAGLELTIDDGPRPEALTAILDTLESHKVHATFFLVGRQIARQWLEAPIATRHLLDRILSDGHAIGFHGMDHHTLHRDHMLSWLPGQVVDSVSAFRQILRVALGRVVPLTYGRLPGGTHSHTPRLRLAFEHAGLKAPVYWTHGVGEWGRYTPLKAIRTLARDWSASARGEPSVVLLHEHLELAAQLDAFLEELKVRPKR